MTETVRIWLVSKNYEVHLICKRNVRKKKLIDIDLKLTCIVPWVCLFPWWLPSIKLVLVVFTSVLEIVHWAIGNKTVNIYFPVCGNFTSLRPLTKIFGGYHLMTNLRVCFNDVITNYVKVLSGFWIIQCKAPRGAKKGCQLEAAVHFQLSLIKCFFEVIKSPEIALSPVEEFSDKISSSFAFLGCQPSSHSLLPPWQSKADPPTPGLLRTKFKRKLDTAMNNVSSFSRSRFVSVFIHQLKRRSLSRIFQTQILRKCEF